MGVFRIGCVAILVALLAVVLLPAFKGEKYDAFPSPRLCYAAYGDNGSRYRLRNYDSLSQKVDCIPGISIPSTKCDLLSVFVKSGTTFLIVHEYESDRRYVYVFHGNHLIKNSVNVSNTARIVGMYNQKLVIADKAYLSFFDLGTGKTYIKSLPAGVYLVKSKGLSGDGLAACIIRESLDREGYFGLFSILNMTVENKFPEMKCRACSISEDGTTAAIFDDSSSFRIAKIKGIDRIPVRYFRMMGNSPLGELSSNGRFLALQNRGHSKIRVIPYGGFFLWIYDLETGKTSRVPEDNVEYQCFAWNE